MTTGTVSSSNLTSLYSNTTSFTAGVVNSSVFSVNGGTGVTVNPTTGNVVVNIGQDVSTSASVTFANVTATGNLSNNYYTLTNSTGIAGQVLTTDGLGVTTWTTNGAGTVTSVSGSGTVNGLTLTGTVTSSGPLTLGGNFALVADTVANLEAVGNAINTTGKYTGKMVVVLASGLIFTATGSAASDVWRASDGTTVATPV